MIERLRARRIVLDFEFDEIYPPSVRALSTSFWTPVAVAVRAAELLVDKAGASASVLDVGSGAGKFCIVGAAVTGALFVGIEVREHLVGIAERAATQLGVTRARFFQRSFEHVDIKRFEAVYFYNPFEENLLHCSEQIDQSVQLSRERFLDQVRCAQALLERARVGTRLVTYHGFGGVVPSTYNLTLRERQRSGQLELWVKMR